VNAGSLPQQGFVMSLLMIDALPLILLAAVVGLGAGWGLAMWMARRLQPPQPPGTPEPTTTERPAAWALRTDTAAAPTVDAAARPGPPPPPATVAPTAPAADLLVVDDSAVARTKLRRLFEGAGYQVQLANDGVEALALLDRAEYRLLITDLEMPNMDGVTLINTCLARPQTARMPILAISGHESLRAKFNECRDICGIHRKPWVDEVLLSHVVALVGARRPRATAAQLQQQV
jgi:chemosensory pili system protein ChpA (sensor histidine kinase/response regulator)